MEERKDWEKERKERIIKDGRKRKWKEEGKKREEKRRGNKKKREIKRGLKKGVKGKWKSGVSWSFYCLFLGVIFVIGGSFGFLFFKFRVFFCVF